MVTYLARQASIALPLLGDVRLDAPALAWTVLIALGVGMLFGLAPAFQAAGHSPQETLKDSGHGLSQGKKHERMRTVLVVSEVALAAQLSACAAGGPRISTEPGGRNPD
jgi:hypothetical protein